MHGVGVRTIVASLVADVAIAILAVVLIAAVAPRAIAIPAAVVAPVAPIAPAAATTPAPAPQHQRPKQPPAHAFRGHDYRDKRRDAQHDHECRQQRLRHQGTGRCGPPGLHGALWGVAKVATQVRVDEGTVHLGPQLAPRGQRREQILTKVLRVRRDQLLACHCVCSLCAVSVRSLRRGAWGACPALHHTHYTRHRASEFVSNDISLCTPRMTKVTGRSRRRADVVATAQTARLTAARHPHSPRWSDWCWCETRAATEPQRTHQRPPPAAGAPGRPRCAASQPTVSCRAESVRPAPAGEHVAVAEFMRKLGGRNASFRWTRLTAHPCELSRFASVCQALT